MGSLTPFLLTIFLYLQIFANHIAAKEFLFENIPSSTESDKFSNSDNSRPDLENNILTFLDDDDSEIKVVDKKIAPNSRRGKWQGNNMAMWGKRNGNFIKHLLSRPISASDNKQSVKTWNRKKWTGKEMAMWGKRSSDKRIDNLDKKWSGKEMAMWGKRNVDDDALNEKRWSGKEMAMWGKRHTGDRDEMRRSGNHKALWRERNNKKWSGKEMPMWGKRAPNDLKNKWSDRQMAMWEKRFSNDYDEKRWSVNDMAMWGKRNAKKWSGNEMPMWGKRSYEDLIKLSNLDSSDLLFLSTLPIQNYTNLFIEGINDETKNKLSKYINSNSVDVDSE